MEGATLNVALVGCVHGELDVIYGALAQLEAQSGVRTDLVLCCGDFQSVRDEADLDSVAVPAHVRVCLVMDHLSSHLPHSTARSTTSRPTTVAPSARPCPRSS